MTIKYGFISDADLDKGLFRVRFDGEGDEDGEDVVSPWISALVPKSKDDKVQIPFDIDEHVACMMDAHLETGVILGALFSEKNAPASGGSKDKVRVLFSDKTLIEYDRQAHKLKIDNDDHDVKIEFNGGQLGGAVKVIELTQKLNNLEKAHNNLNTYVGSLPIPVSGSVSGPATPAAVQGFAINQPTQRTDIEDKNVTH